MFWVGLFFSVLLCFWWFCVFFGWGWVGGWGGVGWGGGGGGGGMYVIHKDQNVLYIPLTTSKEFSVYLFDPKLI